MFCKYLTSSYFCYSSNDAMLFMSFDKCLFFSFTVKVEQSDVIKKVIDILCYMYMYIHDIHYTTY